MDPFKLPEDLTTVEDIQPLLDSALAEWKELSAIADDDLTDEQIDRIEFLGTSVDSIQGEVGRRETEATERTERIAASRARLEAATAVEETEEEAPAEEAATDEQEQAPAEEAADDPAAEVEVIVPDDASELIEEREPVTASAHTPVSQRIAPRAPKADPPANRKVERATLIAAADVPDFPTGQKLTDMGQAAEAFLSRLRGMPSERVDGAVSNHYGVVNIQKVIDPRFDIDGTGSPESDYEKILAAGRESRLEGGSVLAAGGWCSPSETVYSLPTTATVSGILSVPEVTVRRGGLRFTRGPLFSTIYTNSGFLQTEAQAIAGTAKTFIDVECPTFQEVRLDAIGFGVRAGILTASAWPELIRYYLDNVLVAHAHKVNASKISRIVTLLGAAVNANEYGSAVADTLSALEVVAERLRYTQRLNPGQTLEGFAPVWLKGVFRQDLAYRNGVDMLAVSDQQINSFLAVRGIRLQFVYDWQDLTSVTAAWPTSVQVALYPAGTFVAGTSPVIKLNAVYDTASLTTNTYTAAFFEEGLLVMSPSGTGALVDIDLVGGQVGRTGRQDISIANPSVD